MKTINVVYWLLIGSLVDIKIHCGSVGQVFCGHGGNEIKWNYDDCNMQKVLSFLINKQNSCTIMITKQKYNYIPCTAHLMRNGNELLPRTLIYCV